MKTTSVVVSGFDVGGRCRLHALARTGPSGRFVVLRAGCTTKTATAMPRVSAGRTAMITSDHAPVPSRPAISRTMTATAWSMIFRLQVPALDPSAVQCRGILLDGQRCRARTKDSSPREWLGLRHGPLRGTNARYRACVKSLLYRACVRKFKCTAPLFRMTCFADYP